jgi:nitrogen regulatory protein PII
MHFKMIIVMVEDSKTKDILEAAREAGAKGVTVLNQARGEGVNPSKTFLGLSISSQMDVLLMLVEEHFSRHVLETVARVGQFDESSGTGVAVQIDVEDAIGLRHQIAALSEDVEELI